MQSEIEVLRQILPQWWCPLVKWGASFSTRGPRWLPRCIRRMPILFAGEIGRFYVKQVRR